jgi:hypothetical protein
MHQSLDQQQHATDDDDDDVSTIIPAENLG